MTYLSGDEAALYGTPEARAKEQVRAALAGFDEAKFDDACERAKAALLRGMDELRYAIEAIEASRVAAGAKGARL